MPKRYPPEFRRRVLELVKAGGAVAEVAADLGVSTQAIYNWRRQEQIDAGLQAGGDKHRQRRAGRGASADRSARVGARGGPPGGGAAAGGGAPKRRFEMIALMAEESLSVKLSCRLLEVTRAGYYAAVEPPALGTVRSATPGSPTSSPRSTPPRAAPTARRGCTPSCGWAVGSPSATTPWRC